MAFYRFLADVIVVVHSAYVAFVVGGMVLILVGIWRRWRWVRNFWFRILHFAAIGLVVVESLGGVICPLTSWEYDLRVGAGDEGRPGSFIGRWVHDLLFYEFPEWAFTVCYCVFGLAVLVTLLLAPPHRPWTKVAAKP